MMKIQQDLNQVIKYENGGVVYILLSKMCQIINKKITEVNFNDPHWYSTFSWTPEQEAYFKDWCVETLYESPQLQKKLFNGVVYSRRTKRDLRKFMEGFCFQYGWLTEYD